MFNALLDLIYPHLCSACAERKPIQNSCMCLECYHSLAPTSYHETEENALTDLFFGRIRLVKALAYFNFSKGSALQHLIHKLKYGNSPEIGVELGRDYGELLKGVLDAVDCIIPVPLHPKKQRTRGYNQATMFGQGLAERLNTKCLEGFLIRTVHTQTQTQKSRVNRFANVSKAFKIKNVNVLKGKHILLVDDVITTGATIEACALQLEKIPDIRLSVACIALAG